MAGVAGVAGFPAIALPHDMQNAASGGAVFPQDGQARSSGDAHAMQKRAPSGFGWPQAGRVVAGAVAEAATAPEPEPEPVAAHREASRPIPTVATEMKVELSQDDLDVPAFMRKRTN